MIQQVQKRPPGSNATPLFLFHDASGTISNYYALGPIGRDVYAIADLKVGTDMQESLPHMARRYYAAIKSLVTEGKILLGGWSLGGMIALQVAWNFARDPRVRVDGVIMVDSPFPAYDGLVDPELSSSDPEYGPGIPKNKLEKRLLQSVKMLQTWQAPIWRRERQPHIVMLCANEHVVCDDQPALSFVDQFRDSPTLGWTDRPGFVVHKSYTIKGHHFSLFEHENVASLTETVASVAIDMELLTDPDDSE